MVGAKVGYCVNRRAVSLGKQQNYNSNRKQKQPIQNMKTFHLKKPASAFDCFLEDYLLSPESKYFRSTTESIRCAKEFWRAWPERQEQYATEACCAPAGLNLLNKADIQIRKQMEKKRGGGDSSSTQDFGVGESSSSTQNFGVGESSSSTQNFGVGESSSSTQNFGVGEGSVPFSTSSMPNAGRSHFQRGLWGVLIAILLLIILLIVLRRGAIPAVIVERRRMKTKLHEWLTAIASDL